MRRVFHSRRRVLPEPTAAPVHQRVYRFAVPVLCGDGFSEYPFVSRTHLEIRISAHRACSSNAVRAQISAINEKSTQYTGFRLIAMHRKEGGYRFAPHLPNVQKAFANGFLYRSTDSVYENEELGDVSDKTKEQGTK